MMSCIYCSLHIQLPHWLVSIWCPNCGHHTDHQIHPWLHPTTAKETQRGQVGPGTACLLPVLLLVSGKDSPLHQPASLHRGNQLGIMVDYFS